MPAAESQSVWNLEPAASNQDLGIADVSKLPKCNYVMRESSLHIKLSTERACSKSRSELPRRAKHATEGELPSNVKSFEAACKIVRAMRCSYLLSTNALALKVGSWICSKTVLPSVLKVSRWPQANRQNSKQTPRISQDPLQTSRCQYEPRRRRTS